MPISKKAKMFDLNGETIRELARRIKEAVEPLGLGRIVNLKLVDPDNLIRIPGPVNLLPDPAKPLQGISTLLPGLPSIR